jgi:predicted transglutaminase-like cysteine proteinase
MYRVVLRSVAILLPLIAAKPSKADYTAWVDGQNTRSPFMRVYGESMPPVGFVRFCRQNQSDCQPQQKVDARPELTDERWRELVAVNSLVNRNVQPVSDQELYGEIEHWAIPDKKGDCEDYVLLKRHLLIERGWPEGSLLITVVADEKGEGHAVLTARTAKGDYILDNKTSSVQAWSKVPYHFYKRQSYRDPRLWVSLKPQNDLWGTPSAANANR